MILGGRTRQVRRSPRFPPGPLIQAGDEVVQSLSIALMQVGLNHRIRRKKAGKTP